MKGTLTYSDRPDDLETVVDISFQAFVLAFKAFVFFLEVIG